MRIDREQALARLLQPSRARRLVHLCQFGIDPRLQAGVALRRIPGIHAGSLQGRERPGESRCARQAVAQARLVDVHDIVQAQRRHAAPRAAVDGDVDLVRGAGGHTFTEDDICSTCLDPERDASRLCVVESPADQSALERTGAFKGLYFVLMGRLSPLDGIGPKEIGLHKLMERASDGVVQEVILATNFNAEGEATAHVISEALKSRGLHVTRLARGVPVGSELEYVDLGTIAHALVDRR